jgi:hypothetical protein
MSSSSLTRLRPESKELKRNRGRAPRRRTRQATASLGSIRSALMARGQSIPGGVRFSRVDAMAGQEDSELVTMRYETTSAFTATGGAASYLQIKANSIYQPWPSLTDSPAGYQRMFTQYSRAMVVRSRAEFRIWSSITGSVQEPFRMAVVPCDTTQAAVYSAYTNVASLRGVPHSREALFSPGAEMPKLRSTVDNSAIFFGMAQDSRIIAASGQFTAATGADPAALTYFLVGLQSMAGTTTLNCQLQGVIEFDVYFHRPIATAVQSLNRFGNEEVKVEQKADASSSAVVARGEALRSLPSSTPRSLYEEYELVEPARSYRRVPPPGGV